MDYEAATHYDIVITASDGSAVERTVLVTVEVMPVNDNSPVFATASLSPVSLSESSAVGTLLTTVVASDADVDDVNTNHGEVEYRLCNSIEAPGKLISI